VNFFLKNDGRRYAPGACSGCAVGAAIFVAVIFQKKIAGI